MFNAEQAKNNAHEYNQQCISYVLDCIEEASKKGYYDYSTTSLESNQVGLLESLGFSVKVEYDDYYGNNTYEISWKENGK